MSLLILVENTYKFDRQICFQSDKNFQAAGLKVQLCVNKFQDAANMTHFSTNFTAYGYMYYMYMCMSVLNVKFENRPIFASFFHY